MVKAAAAPELLMVTLPVVLAVRSVVVVVRVPIAPLVEVAERERVVSVPAPEIVPEPLAERVIEPADAEPVDTLLEREMAELAALVERETEPPGVVVPRVIAPPTVKTPPEVMLTEPAVVEVIAPVLAVPVAFTFRVLVPRVMVLPELVKVPPVLKVRLY